MIRTILFSLGMLLAAAPVSAQDAPGHVGDMNAATLERLLAGSAEEQAQATSYVAGALDTLTLANSMLAEEGSPFYCAADNVDLSAAGVMPLLRQYVELLRSKPRSQQAMDTLSAGTVVMVMLTSTYPCALGDPENGAPMPDEAQP